LKAKARQSAQLAGILGLLYWGWNCRADLLELCGRSGVCPTITKTFTEVKTQTVITEKFGIRRYAQPEIKELLYKYSEEYGINPTLVFAIAKTESRFQQMRRSENPHVFQKIKQGKAKFPNNWSEELQDDAGKHLASGAIGVMQVMPETAWGVAQKLNIELPSILELFDADKNIKIGCAYLKQCIQESKGSFDKVAVCYNGKNHRTSGWSEGVVKNILESVVANKGA
jgi:soluble lytic murein transglycosylase-like protein